MDEGDEEAHLADTVRAGRSLVDVGVARLYISMGRGLLRWLQSLGFRPGDRGLEGGHSTARVVSAEGSTIGRAVLAVLRVCLEGLGIDVHRGMLEGLTVDGSRAVGAVIDGEVVKGDAVVLATGGYSALFKYFTTPPNLTGSGVEVAAEAGAVLADLEFVQFHPTVAMTSSGLFLVSEVVRGEGAVLVNEKGERFACRYDPACELAPRDVLARAVYLESQHGEVYLDATMVDWDGKLRPILNELLNRGVDPRKEPIRVIAAAHYSIGGVAVSAEGRSSVRGLYVIGEASSSGFHGANRLASNSILEALAQGVLAALDAHRFASFGGWSGPSIGLVRDVERIHGEGVENLKRVREVMWELVGVVRSGEGLRKALRELSELRGPGSLVARLVAYSALLREESRGVHFRVDYPIQRPEYSVRVGIRVSGKKSQG